MKMIGNKKRSLAMEEPESAEAFSIMRQVNLEASRCYGHLAKIYKNIPNLALNAQIHVCLKHCSWYINLLKLC